MATVTKATMTVTSSFDAAPATPSGGLNQQSWGYITLWDIRPWLPFSSRGFVGPSGWQGYLIRYGVMDSKQGAGYVTATQSPKSWSKETRSVVLYDTSLPLSPYTNPSGSGVTSYSDVYVPESISSKIAFDPTTPQNLADTLVVAAYAHNSNRPATGGPSTVDILRLFEVSLEVEFDGGTTSTVWRPTAWIPIAGGGSVGSPTAATTGNLAYDENESTFGLIQETNANMGLFAALWHPAILLLENWSWGTVDCNDPPPADLDEFYTHGFTVTGGAAPYTWSIVSGTLPPGLTLNTSTGVISGTVVNPPGIYEFTVRVADISGITSQVTCSIRVRGGSGWLDLWVWRLLESVPNVDADLVFPPGYDRALVMQLAHDFCRQYGKNMARVTAQLASALAHLETENVSNSIAVEELPPPEEAQGG